MQTQEITATELGPERFIRDQVEKIRARVGDKIAICATSGGVDSSVVTVLGHKALGDRLKACFVENGLMRQGEAKQVKSFFESFGIPLDIVEADTHFFGALQGLTDPELKREAITETFYKKIFPIIKNELGGSFLLQGTILTDIDETKAGIKRQHNVFEQIGIDPVKEFGYQIIEPLVQLRKDGVRIVGQALGLPESMYNRMPFPGPALAARIIGEVTPERAALVRQATAIVEEDFKDVDAFQYLAILHEDQVTGIRDGKRQFGHQIEIRCWDSVDARIGRPTKLSIDFLKDVATRITAEVEGVVSVTYNVTQKPPSTIEAV